MADMSEVTSTGLGAAAGATAMGIVGITREWWKGRNQRDQQDADQAVAIVPSYQALVASLMARIDAQDAKLETASTLIREQAVSNAELRQQLRSLGDRVDILTRHNEADTLTIAMLRAELNARNDELEDARAQILGLQRRIEELESALHPATKKEQP